MVNLILKFVSCSRAAGLRISTSEVLDCLDQLKLVDVLDENQFAAVLRANFAKSRREQYHFNRLYELFFHELRQESGISQADPLAEQIENTLQTFAAEQNGDGDIVMDILSPEQDPPRRITFFPPDDEGWNWVMEMSFDGGETWTAVYRIKATPWAGSENS